MSIAKKLSAIAEGLPKVFSAGAQSRREHFWAEFFKDGAFGAMFAGGGWNTETFKPIYPAEKIKVTSRNGGDRLFYNFNRSLSFTTPLVDLAECCEHIDFSEMPYADRVFNNARAKNITVDFGKCTSLDYAFAGGNGGQLENVTVKVTENCIGYTNPFFYQSGMKELHFTEDSVIAANISFQQASSLSADSVNSIINALQDRTGQTGLKVYFHSTLKAGMTDEQYARITAKNWTVA